MRCSITHEQTEICFTVEYRKRRTTSIQVHRDRSVRVLAPRFTSKRLIMKQVAERAEWILRKKREFADMPALNLQHEYRNGEIFSYLGKKYELTTTAGRPEVGIDGDLLIMQIPENRDKEGRRKLLLKWYRDRSEAVFAERMKHCVKAASALGINEIPEWRSRVFKRSWGSCSAGGRINLNLELVSAPVECIDFVIYHELCHLIEHNHSREFYRLMTAVCPEWKQRRKALNTSCRSGFLS